MAHVQGKIAVNHRQRQRLAVRWLEVRGNELARGEHELPVAPWPEDRDNTDAERDEASDRDPGSAARADRELDRRRTRS
jgi:hypothetical protein